MTARLHHFARSPAFPAVRRAALLGLVALSLSACNAMTRLSEVGAPPPQTPIVNPVQQASYRPVSLPMPAPEAVERQPNSLWRAGARGFFKDQRAAGVGDILTVVIDVADSANISNTSQRSRLNSEDASASAFFGYEQHLSRVLPDAVNPGNLLELDSSTTNVGSGRVARGETIKLRVAALITQILPNGNMVIHGRQEMRVNFENRELQVAGVIRPEDISSTNTITYEKIAEARISYGGRGQITDVQQPRYGQQVLDILMPF